MVRLVKTQNRETKTVSRGEEEITIQGRLRKRLFYKDKSK